MGERRAAKTLVLAVVLLVQDREGAVVAATAAASAPSELMARQTLVAVEAVEATRELAATAAPASSSFAGRRHRSLLIQHPHPHPQPHPQPHPEVRWRRRALSALAVRRVLLWKMESFALMLS